MYMLMQDIILCIIKYIIVMQIHRNESLDSDACYKDIVL